MLLQLKLPLSLLMLNSFYLLLSSLAAYRRCDASSFQLPTRFTRFQIGRDHRFSCRQTIKTPSSFFPRPHSSARPCGVQSCKTRSTLLAEFMAADGSAE